MIKVVIYVVISIVQIYRLNMLINVVKSLSLKCGLEYCAKYGQLCELKAFSQRFKMVASQRAVDAIFDFHCVLLNDRPIHTAQ